MSLWTILQGFLLFANGFAILNNERFLEPYGFGFSQLGGRDISANPGTMKLQVIGLVHAVAYLRVPLIVTNAVVIVVKIVFG